MDQILGISTVVTDDAGQRGRPIYRKMPGHKEIQLFRKDPPAPTVGFMAIKANSDINATFIELFDIGIP